MRGLLSRGITGSITIALLCAVLAALPTHAAAPAKAPTPAIVQKTSFSEYYRGKDEFSAAVVVDAKTGQVLYAYQPDLVWSAASLTKLMGALVFLDHNPGWDALVVMKSVDEVGGGRLRVPVGAKVRVVDLLYSSITGSANNAAKALARVSGLGERGFIRAMNAKAKALGMKRTSFVDPTGIEPKNLTTARDMAILATRAFASDSIRKAAVAQTYHFVVKNTGQMKDVKNTNDLVRYPSTTDPIYVTGSKTGFLYESMYNLVVRVEPEPGDTDRQLIVVVFGSPTREASFASAKNLAKWAWKGYTWNP